MLKQVAVLDDSSEFQQLMEVMMNYLGIDTVVQWTASLEAVPALISNPPDLLVLDVMMAGMGGLAVWSQLRSHPATRQLPIIICTASINKIINDEARLTNDPYTHILPKPFTLQELQQSLDTLIPDWVV